MLFKLVHMVEYFLRTNKVRIWKDRLVNRALATLDIEDHKPKIL